MNDPKPEDFENMPTKQRNAAAYKLIDAAGKEGMSFKELERLHLQGTPPILFKLGVIHRRKRKNGTWAYVANSRASVR